MNVVSLHLPAVRAARLAGQAPPLSVLDLYSEVEDLLEDLHLTPATEGELRDDSRILKLRLVELIDGLTAEITAREARTFTLAAMTGGMFAGALDGTLLFQSGTRLPQPALRSAHPGLLKPVRLLGENLERVLDLGQTSWGDAHVDDLQLLSGYGKHENRLSLEDAEQMEAQTRGDRAQFQTFLLASFKGAYAMGMIDAAVMFVGGERPGAPPK